ncbi:DUF2637 domain-containing protein [Rhodococcus sp. NPDC058481]|uniref:DUF2637 domain-containing protein n=1 Tax=unclassified Rhodococcus (in: high G+C Gram-positive bacteria) TaxID=192944 RepID=UPI0036515D7F
MAITTVICIASFVLSFVALADLLMQTGQPKNLSYLFPVMIDGTILMSTIALVHLSGDDDRKKDRTFFWFVLVIGASVSIAGNALHAYISHAPGFDPRLAAVISAIPPIALLAASHGMTILARRPKAIAAAVGQPAASPRPAESPRAVAIAATAPDISEVEAPEPVGEGSIQPESAHSDVPASWVDDELTAAIATRSAESGDTPLTFMNDDERREYAVRQYASGIKPPVIAKDLGYAPSTVYRWISEARKTRPLVPQAVS